MSIKMYFVELSLIGLQGSATHSMKQSLQTCVVDASLINKLSRVQLWWFFKFHALDTKKPNAEETIGASWMYQSFIKTTSAAY